MSPAHALADKGAIDLGLGAAASLPAGIVLTPVLVQLGLSDALALRADAGLELSDGRARMEVSLGPVISWDVFRLVPEVALAGGVRLSSTRPEAVVRGELAGRYYVSRTVSLVLGLGTLWSPSGWQVRLGGAAWLSLP